MRTFTVVPSFEGESAYFELPDIGFQGDHLSFAILFNLTELTEHWPDITPSMIVTDPKSNTFIAPHTSWDPVKHIFTWNISNVETAYEGYVMCQLKCTSAEDPETIVCMSRICQTRVYQSLEAASNPPEAFQTWIDTLVQLGAEITSDANEVRINTEATENNTRIALEAAEAAELAKNAVNADRISIEQTAQVAVNAQQGATQAQQRAQNAASAAEQHKNAAQEARTGAEEALDEVTTLKGQTIDAKNAAAESESRAETHYTNARAAQTAAEQARDAAVAAKGNAQVAQQHAEEAEEGAQRAQTAAETAQERAETAQAASETAQQRAEEAQAAAETAQGNSETAQSAAETAQANAEAAEDQAKRWAIGVKRDGNPVASTDQQYQNSAKHWSDAAEEALQTLLHSEISSAYYTPEDESITLILGAQAVQNHNQGV